MITRITVRVPATSANMGPGFDCLAMALDIWNSVHVEVNSTGFFIRGEGEEHLPKGESNLVHRCFRLLFQEAGREIPQVKITCDNGIPLGRGLGSSSAATIAGLVAANKLCGRPLSQESILKLAVRVEGHPDNASAALLGGCQIVVQDGDHLITTSVPIPEDLRTVVFVPDVPMPTEHARSILPTEVSRQEAVYNLGRVALLVRALSAGDLTHLAVATQDALHQPARQTIFLPMKAMMRAALNAGALGVFLSGAGSSVLALARGRETEIGNEMAEAASKSGIGGDIRITRPAGLGAHVTEKA